MSNLHTVRKLLSNSTIAELQRTLDENIVDSLASLFKPKERKARMKTVYRTDKKTTNPTKKKPQRSFDKNEKQKRVDAILDKISKSGYESLSKEEKDFLFQAGKED